MVVQPKSLRISNTVYACGVSRYALMMRLAHDAIQRHATAPAMIYISLDQVCH